MHKQVTLRTVIIITISVCMCVAVCAMLTSKKTGKANAKKSPKRLAIVNRTLSFQGNEYMQTYIYTHVQAVDSFIQPHAYGVISTQVGVSPCTVGNSDHMFEFFI